MTDSSKAGEAHCDCGAVALALYAAPLFRILCHCRICQAFNEAAYADMLVYRLGDVEPPEPGRVEFRAWRPPPNVQRGRCARCGKPALELMRLPLLPKLAMIPRANVSNEPPPAVAHLFYHRRVDDVDDALPKHNGYWSSEWAFMTALLHSRSRSSSD